MLHATAGTAIVASTAIGLMMPRAASIAPPSLTEAPVADMQVLYSAVVVPEPTPAATPALTDTPMANAAAPAQPDTPLAMRAYVVEPGDSVRTIAQHFSVTNETIIWENDLTDPDVLQVGQELQILPFSGLIHEVRPGDTVASVANSYDALVRDVVAANKLSDPFVITVGQKLAVPGGYRSLPQKVVVAPSPSGTADTVQAPPSNDDQQAAIVTTAPRHILPTLGDRKSVV